MEESKLVVIRWNSLTIPDEQMLRELMEQEGLQPYRWWNYPGDIYLPHTHPYFKALYVVNGSITFELASGELLELTAGDRLDLPAGIVHAAKAGVNGVICLEATR
ncbi:AraC family ligand binding domain-containing protein [Candidatus Chlorohelix sp.]|uniref:cupin domain-containing protein n=1 Tax=Candidatus Chlorohelix sp. TaxID=3139201 RepID=UPI003031AEAE